jgi:aryl-alcohol dehydrogenase-like predicted oxidoreductase
VGETQVVVVSGHGAKRYRITAAAAIYGPRIIAQAQEAAPRRPAFGLVSEQSLDNLAARTVELEVLPACQGYGIGVIPWSPLHGGLLSGVLRRQAGSGGAGGQGAAGRSGWPGPG